MAVKKKAKKTVRAGKKKTAKKVKKAVTKKKKAVKSTAKKKTTAKAKKPKKVTAKKKATAKKVKKAAKKQAAPKKTKAKKTVKTKKPVKARKVVKAKKPMTAKKATKKTTPAVETKAAVKPASKRSVKPEFKAKPTPPVVVEEAVEVRETLAVSQQDAPTSPASASSLGFVPYKIRTTEDYMNEPMREHFRNILQLWRDRLMHEVDATVVHMKEEAISYPDPLDRAAQEEGFSLELRTRDRERKLIKKIEQALDMIENGEYGFCEDCGTEIGVRRLEARPTAEKCIDCKTFQEIREKQTGG